VLPGSDLLLAGLFACRQSRSSRETGFHFEINVLTTWAIGHNVVNAPVCLHLGRPLDSQRLEPPRTPDARHTRAKGRRMRLGPDRTELVAAASRGAGGAAASTPPSGPNNANPRQCGHSETARLTRDRWQGR
jgi:hypothetical protein